MPKARPKPSACPFAGSFCPGPRLLLLQTSEEVKPQTSVVQGHVAPPALRYPLPSGTQHQPQSPTLPPRISSQVAPLLALSFSPTKSHPSHLSGGG